MKSLPGESHYKNNHRAKARESSCKSKRVLAVQAVPENFTTRATVRAGSSSCGMCQRSANTRMSTLLSRKPSRYTQPIPGSFPPTASSSSGALPVLIPPTVLNLRNLKRAGGAPLSGSRKARLRWTPLHRATASSVFLGRFSVFQLHKQQAALPGRRS